ncbi:hypothetical protein RIEGSTA812A_PEG_343 [invertebrate metagenome]|uniref:Uncharacterized protein n=1 Tax=invertebrate metagenome TaxID=1711999 RepID=A0A484H653_9ZZZZ
MGQKKFNGGSTTAAAMQLLINSVFWLNHIGVIGRLCTLSIRVAQATSRGFADLADPHVLDIGKTIWRRCPPSRA